MKQLIGKARSGLGGLRRILRRWKVKRARRRALFVQNCKSAIITSNNPVHDLNRVTLQLLVRGYDVENFIRSLLREIDGEISALSEQAGHHPPRPAHGKAEVWEKDLARLLELRLTLQGKLQSHGGRRP